MSLLMFAVLVAAAPIAAPAAEPPAPPLADGITGTTGVSSPAGSSPAEPLFVEPPASPPTWPEPSPAATETPDTRPGEPDPAWRTTTAHQTAAPVAGPADSSGATRTSTANPATTVDPPATESPAPTGDRATSTDGSSAATAIALRVEPAAEPAGPTAVSYPNCEAVRAAVGGPLLAGQPGYARHLDADADGVACEDDPADTNAAAHTASADPPASGPTDASAAGSSSGSLASTGFPTLRAIGIGLALVAAGTSMLSALRSPRCGHPRVIPRPAARRRGRHNPGGGVAHRPRALTSHRPAG